MFFENENTLFCKDKKTNLYLGEKNDIFFIDRNVNKNVMVFIYKCKINISWISGFIAQQIKFWS